MGIFSPKVDSLLDNVLKVWKKTNQRGKKSDIKSDVSATVLTKEKEVRQKIKI